MMGFDLLFVVLSGLMIIGALMVISARNPVKSVLSLVFTFVCASGLWLTLQAEFLALVLIVVYVGAVMVLFMFVVMMLNVNQAVDQKKYMSYWFFACVSGVVLFGLIYYVIGQGAFNLQNAPAPALHTADYSNVAVLADKLFSDYIYPFEIAGVILLVAMISAIMLAYRNPKLGVKRQKISQQIAANPKDCITMVDMKSES